MDMHTRHLNMAGMVDYLTEIRRDQAQNGWAFDSKEAHEEWLKTFDTVISFCKEMSAQYELLSKMDFLKGE